MAFRLAKADMLRRDRIAEALTKAEDELEEAVTAFNDALEAARTTLQEKVDAMNEALGEARTFTEEIASDARTEYDDKSDKWREGERGEAACSYVETWEGLENELSEVEIDVPNDIDYSRTGFDAVITDAPESCD
jgi:hypothetical protein